MSPQLELSRASDPARRLAGKVAIVTGAGCEGDLLGTGAAMAILFAAQGAEVGVVDVSAARAANTLELVEQVGGKAVAVVGDITQPAGCERCVAEVVERFDRLDILVNNAAIVAGGGDVTTLDVDAWNRVIALDLNAVMLMSRYAVPHLRAAGGGAIVNISSIAGMRGMGSGAYAAAKGGVIGMTYDLAYVYGRDGIRVNCIAPGHIFTPMGNQGGEELREKRRIAGLLGTEGNAWDVAWCALFLASEESRWITGHVVPVDAGTTSSTALAVNRLNES